jgi:hypothetical protein
MAIPIAEGAAFLLQIKSDVKRHSFANALRTTRSTFAFSRVKATLDTGAIEDRCKVSAAGLTDCDRVAR